MNRPPFEVADIIRNAGDRFREHYAASLTWPQVKVLEAIARCRTAALGGHRDRCSRCGQEAISYNSCRNRHCPKCQTNARDKWLERRQQELLPVGYYHLVFSVPHALVPLIWQNKRRLFSLLFEASAATLLEIAGDPKHLGAEAGFLSILHTWGQKLEPHPHIHCVVPGGGLSPDHTHWIRARSSFFLPVKVLSRVFRGKYVAGLRRAFRHHQLMFYGACSSLNNERNFAAFLRTLFRQDWVVYAKPAFRSRTCSAVSGTLHPSCRHLQPPFGRGLRQRCYLPLEGLCPRQSPTHDDDLAGGVPPPFPSACIAQRVPAHSLLRLAGQPQTQRVAPTLSLSSQPASPGSAVLTHQ